MVPSSPSSGIRAMPRT